MPSAPACLRRLAPVLTALVLCHAAWAQDAPKTSPNPNAQALPEVDTTATARSTTETVPAGIRAAAGGTAVAARPLEGLPASNQPAPKTQAPNIRTTRTVVLATYKGGSFTNHDLTSTLALRQPVNLPTITQDQLHTMNGENLGELVKELVFELLLYEKAKKEGIGAGSEKMSKDLKDYRLMTLSRIYFDKEFAGQVNEKNEENLRQHYEANKESKYTVPEIIALQEIYFALRHPYTVKPGDTLKTIAVRESGSESAQSQFLRNDPLHYFRLGPSTAKGEAPTLEVRAGENLLVPLNHDEETTKVRLAAKALERAKAGEDFAKLVEEYSEVMGGSKSAAFAPDFVGMDPRIVAAVKDAPKGEVTSVIRSANGLHIIKVAERQSTRTKTFEEVRDTILVSDDARVRSIEGARKELLDRLREKYALSIDTDILKRETPDGDKPLAPDTALVTGPDFKYTIEEFRKDMLPMMKSWSGLTYQERLDMARSAPAVTRYLIEKDAVAKGLDKLPEFTDAMRSKEIIEVTTEYLNRQRKAEGEPPEAELREYYNQNISRYTKPAQVTVREITRRVSVAQPAVSRGEAVSKARKELADIRAQIRTPEDFEQMARRESQSIATRSRGGLIGTVSADFRGPIVRNILDQLKPGEVSEPFLYGGEVLILRLDEVKPATPTPFEEVLAQVKAEYSREVPRRKRQAERDRTLQEADFKLAF